MRLTSDAVLGLAPDASSAAAGKKLANARHWRNMGQSAEAVWGECQGSALYQVRVELATLAAKCTCPSHKFPCKHSLGLLLLAASSHDVPSGEPPEWVSAWLAKRAAAHESKQPAAPRQSPEAAAKARARRVEKREALVAHGMESLDLWMNDLIRTGLAGVQSQSTTFWERQAAHMVDAQASGLAARLRHMAEIPGASSDWPERLLGELGRLALLTDAYRRRDTLDAALCEDVRQLVGWTLNEEEVAARGEVVADDWLIVGQHVTEEDRGRVQRTWLLGVETRRPALVVQFAFMNAPFKDPLLPGVRQRGETVFWPGAGMRARFLSRTGEGGAIQRIRGHKTIAAFLDDVAAMLARQPWQDRFLCALHDVTPVYDAKRDRWYIRDMEGAVLPLSGSAHWKLLALSGALPVDIAGEWDGEMLLPLGVVADQTYYALAEVW